MALVGKKLWWIAAVLILSGSGVSGQETDEGLAQAAMQLHELN